MQKTGSFSLHTGLEVVLVILVTVNFRFGHLICMHMSSHNQQSMILYVVGYTMTWALLALVT